MRTRGNGKIASKSRERRSPGDARGARRAIAALVATAGFAGAVHAAPNFQVLMSFGGSRGTSPLAAPVADGAGNLYMTAAEGGMYGYGVVVELSPPAQGLTTWTRTVLHSFDQLDGEYPGQTLILDGDGNLYGTAAGGAQGDGVVFELSPPAAHKSVWKETVLHTFSGPDGQSPGSALIADGAGDLYGTAGAGGAHGAGVVYELMPPPAGQKDWSQTVLYAFSGPDGQAPDATLLADGEGNLYGTAFEGGAHGGGVAYELSPPPAGQTAWSEVVLHSFDGPVGFGPGSPMIADGAGNFYGTAGGGAQGYGLVYELAPPTGGKTRWTETVLRDFDGTDGKYPVAGVVADGAGNLYGMTYQGGADKHGVVYELSPPAVGKKRWTETLLHTFDGQHGKEPYGGMTADGAGNFYGTTRYGGNHGEGTVFKLTP